MKEEIERKIVVYDNVNDNGMKMANENAKSIKQMTRNESK